ncbi:unnamed protein product [Rodentolepis nana]|uniref:Tetraspanin n=1 Tax=Rodentolepis nana TaxID=102285 RepID=A0A0R3TZY6_RODNA|nr:unnamed protein product [Rodentolepis nana]
MFYCIQHCRLCKLFFLQSSSDAKIAGIVMAGFGIFLLVESRLFGFSGASTLIPVLITIVGLIVLAVGVLGICGAIKMSRGILIAFAVAMGIIILAEIVVGSLLFVYKSKFKEGLAKYFGDAIRSIGKSKNTSTEFLLRKTQDAFKCCGAKGSDDWPYPCRSCCKLPIQRCAHYNREGCVDVIYAWISKNLLAFGAVIAILALLEIGAIVAAIFLIKQL